MRKTTYTYRILIILLLCLLQGSFTALYAQSERPKAQQRREGLKDSTATNTNIQKNAEADSIQAKNAANIKEMSAPVDTAKLMAKNDSTTQKKVKKEKKKFMPDPQKSMWIALAIPGGGQIYNRKYWKLPIIYGGFVGCAYALHWNNMMYSDYSQYYLDIMSNDPNKTSYLDMLPDGYNVEANRTTLQNSFKKKKDYYRRYRDLSIFAFIGVYAISVIDAYVDAELSNFDISNDLSLHIYPAIIHSNMSNGWSNQAIGFQCSITF